jgi:hypothetical protein
MDSRPRDPQFEEAIREESRRVRRLQLTVQLVSSVICQGDLSYQEASDMVAATRNVALALFPGKELAYELLYQPRLQRLLVQRYRLH